MHLKGTRFLLSILLISVIVIAGCTQSNDQGLDSDDPFAVNFPTLENVSFNDEDIVAAYEGGEIKGIDFKNYLLVQAYINPYTPINDVDYQRELLEYFIMESWISKHIQKDQYDEVALQDTIDNVLQQILFQYDEKTQAKGFQTLNINEDHIKAYLHSYFLADYYFQNQITEAEVEAFYTSVKDEITYSTVRHLLISTNEIQPDGSFKEIRTDEEAYKQAFELYDRIQAGESFEDLITAYSEDPGSKDALGLYEDIPVMQWADGFREAVLEQELGIIGYPVNTEYGYHIVKVEGRYVLELEEVREAILGHLAADKYMDFLDFELEFIIIEINL